jgi:hypothetical protein
MADPSRELLDCRRGLHDYSLGLLRKCFCLWATLDVLAGLGTLFNIGRTNSQFADYMAPGSCDGHHCNMVFNRSSTQLLDAKMINPRALSVTMKDSLCLDTCELDGRHGGEAISME